MEPLDSRVLCRREGDLAILERKPAAVPPTPPDDVVVPPPSPPEADEPIETSRGLESVILLCTTQTLSYRSGSARRLPESLVCATWLQGGRIRTAPKRRVALLESR